MKVGESRAQVPLALLRPPSALRTELESRRQRHQMSRRDVAGAPRHIDREQARKMAGADWPAFASLFDHSDEARRVDVVKVINDLFKVPADAEACQPVREALHKLLEKATAANGKPWTAADVAAIEDLLAHGRAILDAQVRGCASRLPMLEFLFHSRSGKFQEVYSAVFKLVRQEDGFEAFTKHAAKVVEATKVLNADFRQSDDDLVSAFAHGIAVRPKFVEAFEAIAEASGAKEVKMGPVKDLFRALEKTCMRTTNRWKADNIHDVVRCQIVCASVAEMAKTLQLIVDDAKGRISVNACKDRFSKPTKGGWADCMLKVSMASDPHNHQCEVQIVHEKLIAVRNPMREHDEYAQFRSAKEILDLHGAIDFASVPPKTHGKVAVTVRPSERDPAMTRTPRPPSDGQRRPLASSSGTSRRERAAAARRDLIVSLNSVVPRRDSTTWSVRVPGTG